MPVSGLYTSIKPFITTTITVTRSNKLPSKYVNENFEISLTHAIGGKMKIRAMPYCHSSLSTPNEELIVVFIDFVTKMHILIENEN